MISYAQNAEDVLLRRVFPDGDQGFYVDVGANHPTLHSVTRHFSDRGWTGVNVEPVARVWEMLQAERPRDVNLSLAISDHEGTMTLHEPSDSLGMSTLDVDFAAGLKLHGYSYVERTVEVITLATLCERHVGDRTIDFLKIDVEGHELAVIRGADWGRWRPRVLVIEATIQPETWEPILLAADYLPAAFDGLNRYYVREEDRTWLSHFQSPVNVLDDYVSFEHLHELEILRRERDDALARLSRYEDLGATSLTVARQLRRVARHVPIVPSVVRRMLPRVG
jgi:FkbM family methyltransferase